MDKESAQGCLDYLRSTATALQERYDRGVSALAEYVLKDEKFFVWSGSSKENQHHYGDHGLIHHVREVVETCMTVRALYPQYEDIDDRVLYLAALYHDIGKVHDYEKVNHKWRSAQHKRRIHHISRSAIMWNRCLDEYESSYVAAADEPSYEFCRDDVTHAILAHHGQREWGSPVAPNTRIAWLLHKADGISARLFDCHTLDRV